jgi:hypothetical protein
MRRIDKSKNLDNVLLILDKLERVTLFVLNSVWENKPNALIVWKEMTNLDKKYFYNYLIPYREYFIKKWEQSGEAAKISNFKEKFLFFYNSSFDTAWPEFCFWFNNIIVEIEKRSKLPF